MSNRVTGYHYVTGKDGKRHRVYDSPQAKAVYKANRSKPGKVRQLKGRGGYYDSAPVKWLARNVPKGTFRSAGGAVAGPLGSFAGDMLSKLAGFGAYTVKQNSLIGEGESPAAMHSTNSSCVIRHREYIGDVIASPSAPNTFDLSSYSINPGLYASFPWLSAIAAQYQQYRFRGLVYEFKTLYADAIASAASNATIGGVIMATDYNVLGGTFQSKQAMDNTEYTTSSKPSCSFYHPIECKPGTMPTEWYFVRSGSAPAGSDARLFDMGLFQIATFGIAATSVVVGELWVTYEIELAKPILGVLGNTVLSDHFKLSGVDNSNPLGTTSTASAGNSLGGTVNSISYNFPADAQSGYFMVYWIVAGTAAAITNPGLTFNNCTAVNAFLNKGVSAMNCPVNTTTSSEASYCIIVKIPQQAPGSSASVVWSSGTLPTSITNGDLYVTQIDSDLITNL